jgi:hypothetical protein
LEVFCGGAELLFISCEITHLQAEQAFFCDHTGHVSDEAMHDDWLDMAVRQLNNYHEASDLEVVTQGSQLLIFDFTNVVVLLHDERFEISYAFGVNHTIL